MAESENRVTCPHCQAENLLSSSTCWQCSRPMTMRDGGESIPPEPNSPQENMPIPEMPSTNVPPPPSRPGGDTSIYVILGFIFAGLGVVTFFTFCCGWPFVIAGIVMGILAYGKGNKLGGWIIALSILGLIVNLAWSAYLIRVGFNYQNMGGNQGGFPFPGTPTPHGSGPFGPNASPLPHTTPTPQ